MRVPLGNERKNVRQDSSGSSQLSTCFMIRGSMVQIKVPLWTGWRLLNTLM